jgi:hypothetical protein
MIFRTELEKNQGLGDGHWIYLRCQASAHPKSFNIVAMPSWGGRGGVELDSNGKFASR